jgi:Protein of unknown function (DUF2785)
MTELLAARWARGTRARLQLCALGVGALLLVFNDARGHDRTPVHDKAFWTALRAGGFKLPSDQPVMRLALEATALLGSTDAELRDAVAYEALATWIYQEERLGVDELEQLRVTLAANARRGLGEEEGDGLFLRSFSILVLSVLAAEDLKKPFLDSGRFDVLVDLAIGELDRERDLRGYVPGKGWGHATAHCADLVKFLSRSHWLRTEQQARIVDAIAGRLRSAGRVFVWGEDARLAAALTSLALRSDVDPGAFDAWFTRLREEHAAVWSGPFDPAQYVPVRAQLNTVSAFAADLHADAGPAASIRAALRSLRVAAHETAP